MSQSNHLKDVTKRRPCPACGGDHRCRIGPDVLHCFRLDATQTPDGWRKLPGKSGSESVTYKPADDDGPRGGAKRPAPAEAKPAAWQGCAAGWSAALTTERIDALAAELGVPADVVATLDGIGWATAAELRAAGAGGVDLNRVAGGWTLPERDASGRLIGMTFRVPGGGKGGFAGSSRGLTVPATFAASDAGAVVLVVEGASDVLAATAAGLIAVGRPSNTGGVDLLAELLADRAGRVVVVGENDRKADGAWPGRDGAKSVAVKLAGAFKRSVRWATVPADAKDVRAWLTKNAGEAGWRDAGRRLLALLESSAEHALTDKLTAGDRLAALAATHLRFGRRDDDGEAFACLRDADRANLAMPLRGRGGTAATLLAKLYRDATGKVPAASATADVLAAAEGDAAEADAEPVGLRVAELPDAAGVVVDLGTADGRAVVVTPGRWELAGRSPILFRRTPMIAPMPTPVRRAGVTLVTLRNLLNVRPDDWPPLVGWMVATLMPAVPCPILLMTGMQGTGKSSAARLVRLACDPSPVPLAGEPRDAEAWAMHAGAARVVGVDNVSRVLPWWSDALCRTVTGDGLVRRALYTNADAAVLKVKRPVLLTSIDAGALRGDLAERLVTCELDPVEPGQRRAEAELGTLAAAALPGVLADLLDALAGVLKATAEGVKPPASMTGRMADFCGVLAALDAARPDLTGGRALELYHGQRSRVAGDVVASDPLASAVKLLAASAVEWSGTAGELLDLLNGMHRYPPHGDARPPRGWPADATRCGGQLKRLVPSLDAAGVRVTMPRRGKGGQVYELLDESAGHGDETCPTPASPASPASPRPPAEGDSSVARLPDRPMNGRNGHATASVTAASPAAPQRHPPDACSGSSAASGDAGDADDAVPRQVSPRPAAPHDDRLPGLPAVGRPHWTA